MVYKGNLQKMSSANREAVKRIWSKATLYGGYLDVFEGWHFLPFQKLRKELMAPGATQVVCKGFKILKLILRQNTDILGSGAFKILL